MSQSSALTTGPWKLSPMEEVCWSPQGLCWKINPILSHSMKVSWFVYELFCRLSYIICNINVKMHNKCIVLACSDTSSSSSCHVASTDIPDPLLPLLPIIHRLWQVFRAIHPISSHSCCMYVRAGCPAFAWPYTGVHRSTSLMSAS